VRAAVPGDQGNDPAGESRRRRAIKLSNNFVLGAAIEAKG
jgi:hypothetical protein